MSYTVIVMPGEGIGPEVVNEGVRVLRAAAKVFRIPIELLTYEVGKAAFARTGEFLPRDARDACDRLCSSRQAAILFGSVDDEPIGYLRKDYDLFANLRPIRAIQDLWQISPLKPERIRNVDLLIVRELVSDIYYGISRTGGVGSHRWASQEMYYSEHEVERIARVAFEQARIRRRCLTFVHKGNVINGVFDLWQDVLRREHCQFLDVALSDVLVDAAALHLVLQPGQFDVLLCPNLFGDILSDIGGAILGSVGLLPSASLNAAGFALYECVGGTAPDIAGMQKANPIGTILSVAMMCRHTFRNDDAATLIERAVVKVLESHRTPDIMQLGCHLATTAELGTQIADQILLGMT